MMQMLLVRDGTASVGSPNMSRDAASTLFNLPPECWSLNFVVAYYANFVIYQDSPESPDLPNSGQLERVECFPDLLGIY